MIKPKRKDEINWEVTLRDEKKVVKVERTGDSKPRCFFNAGN